MAHSLARNTTFMTLASVGQKVIAFVYFTLVARTIGVENTGSYTLALSFTTIFVVFVDLGLTNVLVREGARYKERLSEYLSTVLGIKLFLGVLAYIAAQITASLLGYSPELRGLIVLSGVTMLLDSLHLSLYGTLRAVGNLRWESYGIVASQGITLVLGFAFLFFHLPLLFLILAFTIASLCNVLYASSLVYFKYGIRFVPSLEWGTAKRFIVIALPFAIAAVFARLYSYLDQIILSQLLDTTAVGLYSIATKVTFSFQFIPLALVASLYPRLSEYFVSDKKKLVETFEQSMVYLFLVAAPISCGIALIAPDAVSLLYGPAYLGSVIPLQILSLSLLFSFVSFPIGALLNACNRQTTQTALVGLVLLTNIAMNIILIPRVGVLGAAWAAFFGNALLTISGYIAASCFVLLPHRILLAHVGKISLAALGMVGAVALVLGHVSFLYAIPVGGTVYVGLLFATGLIKREHLTSLRERF